MSSANFSLLFLLFCVAPAFAVGVVVVVVAYSEANRFEISRTRKNRRIFCRDIFAFARV